jgi:hypothetical protein
VQVRLSVKCLTCQRSSPVNRLALDGRFYCLGCSREMFFDEDIWEEKVAPFASALGDAFWSHLGVFPAFPQVPRDVHDVLDFYEDILSETSFDDADLLQHLLTKCNDIGRETSGLTMTQESGMVISGGGMKTGAFSLAMSPGHPLCLQCKTPLGVQVIDDGLVSTSCARCGARDNYRAPEDASDSDIEAVIAPEHVDGREVARVAAQPGSAAVAASCPKCGSSLQFAPGARIANCPYCKTTSVVPDHVAAVGAPADARPEPIWLGFRSPSSARTAIVDALQGRADRANEQSRQQEQARMREGPERKESQPNFGGAITFASIVLAAGVGIYFAVLEKPHHSDSTSSAAATTSTRTAKTPKAPPTDPIPIASCKCVFGDGQSTPQITLTLQAPPSEGSPSIPWSLEIERHSGFITEETGVALPITAGALLPPALDTKPPERMGIACDTGIFVLVGDKVATGWSSVNGSWKWNASLPSPSVDAANADVPSVRGSSYAGGCVPLATKNGAVALKLANGRHVSLSLKDGKVH